MIKALEALICENSIFEDFREITSFDRFQASDGIINASNYVGDKCKDMGLSDVTITSFIANGEKTWWDFRSPVSWTPVCGLISKDSPTHSAEVIHDSSRSPFSLATYSMPTKVGGEVFALWGLEEAEKCKCPTEAILLIPSNEFDDERLSYWLSKGFRGYATDNFCKADLDGSLKSGRIELPPKSDKFAFSLTPNLMTALASEKELKKKIRVQIDISRESPMPLVSAKIPGKTKKEIWILSHICHPGPGANDNGSGVVASLAVASALAEAMTSGGLSKFSHTIRFVWGPEFLGTVAALSSFSPPEYVINLDMVGENQELCKSPLVMEMTPDFILSPMNAIAENAVKTVFEFTNDHFGQWNVKKFQGFSDHSVFSNSCFNVPSIQICHPADRFNHSAADTLDKVSIIEMKRAILITLLTLIGIESCDSTAGKETYNSWKEKEIRDAKILMQGLKGSPHEAWAFNRLQYYQRTEDLPIEISDFSKGIDKGEAIVTANWEGPLNLREMIFSAPADIRQEFNTLMSKDKSVYSKLLNLGILIDGERSKSQITELVSYQVGCPRDPKLMMFLWTLYEETAWVNLA